MAFTKVYELNDEILAGVEERIGYVFRYKDKLRQAFVRSSYSSDENNEILEFFGDTALGLVVVKKMSESYAYHYYDVDWIAELRAENPGRSIYNHLVSDYTEGEMTEIKKSLVSTGALAGAIEELGFADYLVMSAGDVKSGVDREAHVREDLFEAIVGAVALDSCWNVDALTGVVDRMLNPDPVIERGYEIEEDYVAEVAAMVNTAPVYKVCKTDRGFEASVELGYTRALNPLYNLQVAGATGGDGDSSEKIKVIFGGTGTHQGFGKTETGAKRAAAKKLIEFVKFQKKVLESLDFSRPGECVSMLNELWQKNLIPKPEYDVRETEDKTETGNPVWSCNIKVGDDDDGDIGESKQAAKNNAAMRMIYSLLKFNNIMTYFYDPSSEIRVEEFKKFVINLNKEMKI